MPITYQQESLHTIKREVETLSQLEWEEVNHFKDIFPLDIDWELYYKLEDLGLFKVFTVRDDKTLVGYFSVIASPALHSSGRFRVGNDALFLHKDYRKNFIGVKLIQFVEQCLREDGFHQLQITFTEKNDITPMLNWLGYEKVETKFEKRLNS